MSTSIAVESRYRRRWLVRAIWVLALLGFVAGMIGVQVKAGSDLDRGKAALDADDPGAARVFFERCIVSRPGNAEAHFRAAQAARRCADLQEAVNHLDMAAKYGWDEAAIKLERALVQAQAGNLRSVENILLWGAAEGHPEARHVLAVLVPAFMAEFRWVEANELVDRWVRLQPESGKVWAYRGEILERLRRMNDAVNALREAARLDPADQRIRFALARLLLETRQPPDEAAEHLEWLAEVDPRNSDILVQLAVARENQGDPAQAQALLDQAIAASPRDGKAYFYRGRLELNRGRPAIAGPFLRRSVELSPYDREFLYALFLCLQQVGTPAEARAAEERWKRCDADLKKTGELAKAISAAPRDPNLRAEMGELFLKNGREADGLRWLESALRERPDHPLTNRLLAVHYERTGQLEKAAHHRTFVHPVEARGRD